MITHILFLITGLIGLVVIFIMISSYRSNQLFNIYLMLIFSMVSVRFLIHATYGLQWQLYVKASDNPAFFLGIIPCFYLYYKNLVNESASNSFKDLKHFIPIVLFYVVHKSTTFNTYYWSINADFTLLALYVSTYVYISYSFLRNHLWLNTSIKLSVKHYKLLKNWTIYLFVCMIIGGVFFIISIYNELVIGAISGGSMPRFLIFCWVLIFAKTLISPEILFGLPRLNKQELLSDSEMIIRENWFVDFTPEISVRDEKLAIILKEHIFSYAKNIDQVCYNNLLFRDKTFKINNLSQLLKVPESHLIYLFKYHSSLSFSEYRTQCRINDAITLISKNYLEKNTLESLAIEVGFSSYNPFYTSFKISTKFSPTQYILKNGPSISL
jgi:AraC-like DNA-binding protein